MAGDTCEEQPPGRRAFLILGPRSPPPPLPALCTHTFFEYLSSALSFAVDFFAAADVVFEFFTGVLGP